MKLFPRILVAISGTNQDTSLIEFAHRLASLGIGETFHFVHVLDQTMPASDQITTQDQLEMQVQLSFGKGLSVASQVHLLSGDRLDRLLEVQQNSQADLILLGHRKQRSGRRSMAHRLAMMAPCSIWLVPEGAPNSLKKIIAPVDFSACSADALKRAIEVAKAANLQEILSVHVYFDADAVRYEDQELREKRIEEDHFETFLQSIPKQGVVIQSLCEEGSDPARTILRITSEQRGDLIVLNTRGRSQAAAILLGSVTGDVLSASSVPVLVVKQPGTSLGLFGVLKTIVSRNENPKMN